MGETFSKKRAWFGWCLYDWANSAFATVCLAAVLPVYFLGLVPETGALISVAGWSITMPAASLWGYAVSCSMLVVALLAPWFGARADRLACHRRYLLTFCLAGSGATFLLATAGPGDYLLACALFMIGNIAFAGGNVFYNAFLPSLAGPQEVDHLSSRGFAAGYLGGGLALLLVFALIAKHQTLGLVDQASATRVGFMLTGCWWLFFGGTAVSALPASATSLKRADGLSGVKGYVQTFSEILAYRNLALFLLAFLLYNDGIQTIIVVAAIFGSQELQMSQGAILACYLMIQFVAMPATLLCGRLADGFGAKKVIMFTLVLFIGVTVYAYFMTTGWQFWLLGFWVALILGGSQAISRSLFGSMVPKGKNAEFFGFYAISAKFASVLGPFLFAVIAEFSGSVRLAILALLVFFLIGLLLLARVNVEQGRREALKG